MKYYGITDRGKLRRSNQDSYVIATNQTGDVFAMVCDGIGGGKGGDVASRIAVSYFSMAFSENEGFSSAEETEAWVREQVDSANARIFETGRNMPELHGMGTTLSGVLITKHGRYVVNIGDSRTYSYTSAGYFRLLTEAHTLVNDMLKHGELTPEQAEKFPRKNVLTNALGVWEKVHADIFVHNEELSGFLICSDGLHGYVEESVIRTIVLDRETDPALRVRRLYQAAMDAGGYDNITAILIDLEGDEAHEQF